MTMKHILNKYKNILLGVSLLIIGVVLGVAITTYFPLLAGIANIKPQSQPVKVIDEAEMKKQALAKFYNEIITAQDNQDWEALYSLIPQSVRENVTKEKFIATEKAQAGKDKLLSQNTIIHSLEVNGNNGIVERTIVTCMAKDCTGNNRKEDTAKKEYVYVNGKWQIPDPQPSERALKTVVYIYLTMSESEQKKFVADNGYGSDSSSFATRNYAIFLDNNLDKLALAEAWVDKNKTDSSRPVVNYQPPAIINQPAPVVQQQTFPRNCTSNTIGNYTYTNCY